ncbi:hypothetical protein [Spirosoma rhododendri]|uniref:Uncharacterized protein n=1 Tax=Spirosoma rhododendri TaxID=2728024 RepID=A0A7L5DUC6_9BACT|nr:hypothetical protein [Spirosoma rhododendri]QJD79567.1 hypothetical protein HH216_14950 [Spirosoma rhododendri]
MSELATAYRYLDINQKINLKTVVSKWLQFARERFGEDLEKFVYNRKRSSRKRPLRRSYRLKSDWSTGMNMSGNDVNSAFLSFLLYGRFVDMGVGKGTDYATSQYQKVRKNGEPRNRRPARWYAKRKGYETHRLRELLVDHYVSIPITTIENALTGSVSISV